MKARINGIEVEGTPAEILALISQGVTKTKTKKTPKKNKGRKKRKLRRSSNVTARCPECNDLFVLTPNQIGNPQSKHFCSQSCASRYRMSNDPDIKFKMAYARSHRKCNQQGDTK